MQIASNRVLRTKTRKPDSSYKVNCEKVTAADTLILNIFDENNTINPLFTYCFSGKKLEDKNSIHFIAQKSSSGWSVKFYGIQPD